MLSFFASNVWFQKISIPTPLMVIENSEGVGISKAKIFKRKCEAKLEFLEGCGGGGFKVKNHPIQV